jgi:hypothetical protein
VLFLRSLPVLVLVFASTSLADGVDAGGIFHIKPVQPMGTTSVPDLTDVTWDGDKPCVAQGTPEQHVRCWDPATKRSHSDSRIERLPTCTGSPETTCPL